MGTVDLEIWVEWALHYVVYNMTDLLSKKVVGLILSDCERNELQFIATLKAKRSLFVEVKPGPQESVRI